MKNNLKKTVLFVAGAALICFVSQSVARADNNKKTDSKKMKTVPTSLCCQYKVGKEHTVRFTSNKLNKVWVEMPKKKPTLTGQNETQHEIVLRTKVESVDKDGSAILNVTIEQIKFTMTSDVRKKKSKNEYYSDAKKNTSTSSWPNEPKLHGASYKIKIAPDTTVKEVIGIDKLYKKIGVDKDDRRIVIGLINEEKIKRYHERDFLRYCPGRVASSKGEAFALPTAYEGKLPIPDAMIKAKAIKKTFKVHKVQKEKKAHLVKVVGTAEPLYVLPEGIEEPPALNDFGKTMIKRMSDMNELKITDEALFDLSAGVVRSEKTSVECTLIILEENIGMGQGKNKKKGAGGAMFTMVKIDNTYELVK
ncbi:MAG: hypothetical protein KAJ52_02785 [Sedimentisphaerales bacterium]|nr:hypothetical protein [Sedimentisphaerales bacterium]